MRLLPLLFLAVFLPGLLAEEPVSDLNKYLGMGDELNAMGILGAVNRHQLVYAVAKNVFARNFQLGVQQKTFLHEFHPYREACLKDADAIEYLWTPGLVMEPGASYPAVVKPWITEQMEVGEDKWPDLMAWEEAFSNARNSLLKARQVLMLSIMPWYSSMSVELEIVWDNMTEKDQALMQDYNSQTQEMRAETSATLSKSFLEFIQAAWAVVYNIPPPAPAKARSANGEDSEHVRLAQMYASLFPEGTVTPPMEMITDSEQAEDWIRAHFGAKITDPAQAFETLTLLQKVLQTVPDQPSAMVTHEHVPIMMHRLRSWYGTTVSELEEFCNSTFHMFPQPIVSCKSDQYKVSLTGGGVCAACDCHTPGSTGTSCADSTGQCTCKLGYSGAKCDTASPICPTCPTCPTCPLSCPTCPTCPDVAFPTCPTCPTYTCPNMTCPECPAFPKPTSSENGESSSGGGAALGAGAALGGPAATSDEDSDCKTVVVPVLVAFGSFFGGLLIAAIAYRFCLTSAGDTTDTLQVSSS